MIVPEGTDPATITQSAWLSSPASRVEDLISFILTDVHYLTWSEDISVRVWNTLVEPPTAESRLNDVDLEGVLSDVDELRKLVIELGWWPDYRLNGGYDAVQIPLDKWQAEHGPLSPSNNAGDPTGEQEKP